MEYWKQIRQKVGHDKVFLPCSGAAILDDNNRVLLQKLNKQHEDMFKDLREYLKDYKVKIR